MRRRLALVGFCALAALALGAGPAQAERALISTNAVKTNPVPPGPGEIEDACGVALGGGDIYVSDYYHRRVDVFKSNGEYETQIALPGGPFTGIGSNSLDAVCGLATGPGGALYANYWHRSVTRLAPSELSFDSHESTGVAVDQSTGRVYVDDRTYVAVYEPSGAPVALGGEPLRIGLGPLGESTLGDAYGLAVSGGRVYVADAAANLVKVYEPAGDPLDPVATIAGPPGGFRSLVDASLAIDSTNGHLLVIDDLQPGFVHPEAAVEEFDSSGAFLGRVGKVIDGEPSGLALSGGDLYVTSGNDEEARVLEFGPYMTSVPAGSGAGGGAGAGGPAPAPQQGSAASPPTPTPAASHGPKAHASELVQRGHVRVALRAAFAPHALPRTGTAPIRVSVGAQISSTDGGEAPQLRRMTIALNREGRFDPTGLPLCRLREIEPATTRGALEACRGALIGEGRFEAKVHLGRQSPFPQAGKLYAFNARLHGRPAILAHVYGTKPVPTSYTLPFEVGRAKGTFGIVLRASLPQVTGDSGFITGLSLRLGRSFSFRGHRHSYLSAGCPAPKGFPGALFAFARAKLSFAGGKSVASTLTRSCRVR
jgi:hypothetical protein